MNHEEYQDEWWKDWREGACVFAFIVGCYVLLVLAGVIVGG